MNKRALLVTAGAAAKTSNKTQLKKKNNKLRITNNLI
jgi:hypothetical protein